jgi:hypothetical protein
LRADGLAAAFRVLAVFAATRFEAPLVASFAELLGVLAAIVFTPNQYNDIGEPAAMDSASALIDQKIKELGDWRGEMLARVRRIIHDADPEIVEEWKWMGTPVWSHSGIVCTGETYKNVVKMTFAKGAALNDPSGLFNSSLDGNVRRAIDIREGDPIDEAALTDLIRAAIALNVEAKSKPKRATAKRSD